MYTKDYKKVNHAFVEGFDVPVILPSKPKPSEFRNFGLPVEKQKFYRDEIPKDIFLKPKHEYDKFVDEQWHKRKNGEWWLIKGQEIYITGPCWLFLEWWEMEAGGRPDFRMEAVEWFWVWDHCLNDPNCFGMLDLKCRRLGDTEKALCAGWELTTRYRKSWFGMQNINAEDAQANYMRVVEANAEMVKWFKPIHRGPERPEKKLEFKYPSDMITAKSLREKTDDVVIQDETPELGSKIDYKPTKHKAYDGKRLRYWHMDEPGKLSPKEMNVVSQWGVVKKCLSLFNEKVIIGKAMLTSTVEDDEKSTGESVRICRELWEGSDPRQLNAVGRTLTGLYRYFRNFENAAEVDEWGFHRVDEARKYREAQIESFLKVGDLEGLTRYKRQVPKTIEEALSVPATDCVLYPALLDIQMERIKDWSMENMKMAGHPGYKPFPQAVRGDFAWKSGFKSEVMFVPNDNGKFWVSGHPSLPNYKMIQDGRIYPGNKGQFTIGVDGIDHKGKTGSDFSISVFRTWDPKAEIDLLWEEGEHGPEIVNKYAMKTRRFVCTYSHRPANPEEAYEDCLKCSMYYGAPIYAERQKPGVLRYFERFNMHAYLGWKSPLLKLGARKENDAGQHQSQEFAVIWMDELKMHIYHHIETYVHHQQLSIFRNFTGENPGECDQVISSGLALVDARQYIIKMLREEQMPKTESRFPFTTFATN